MDIDLKDRKIIFELQRNGKLTNLELAEKINLSPSPCLRRVRILEEKKIIRFYTAVVDESLYGMPLMAFIRVTLKSHNTADIALFESEINNIDNITECYVLSGGDDYLLKVMSEGLDEYERFIRTRLHTLSCIKNIETSFVYSSVKRKYTFPQLSKK